MVRSIEMSRIHILSAVSVAAILAMSCTERKQREEPAAIKRFSLRGEVMLLIPSMDRVVIRHDAITGWSAAANMEYPVKDRKALEMLTVGDHIRGAVFVQDSAYWLGEIEILSGAKAASPGPDVPGDRPAGSQKGR